MGPTTIEPQALKRLTDPEVRRFLVDKWDLIEDLFAPAHMILFGSRVNGTPHEWSDIDAIVVSDRFADVHFMKRAHHFQKSVEPHVAMTTLCYTPEEFAVQRTIIGVVGDACREGVWLK